MVPAKDRPRRTKGPGCMEPDRTSRWRVEAPTAWEPDRGRGREVKGPPDPTRPGPATAAIPNPARARGDAGRPIRRGDIRRRAGTLTDPDPSGRDRGHAGRADGAERLAAGGGTGHRDASPFQVPGRPWAARLRPTRPTRASPDRTGSGDGAAGSARRRTAGIRSDTNSSPGPSEGLGFPINGSSARNELHPCLLVEVIGVVEGPGHGDLQVAIRPLIDRVGSPRGPQCR